MSPIYEYKCSCGSHYEVHHSVENRDNEVCPDCGYKPQRICSVPSNPVVYEYYSESLDAQITGPKQKSQLMKAKSVTEAA